jgi:hypothetical protein
MQIALGEQAIFIDEIPPVPKPAMWLAAALLAGALAWSQRHRLARNLRSTGVIVFFISTVSVLR